MALLNCTVSGLVIIFKPSPGNMSLLVTHVTCTGLMKCYHYVYQNPNHAKLTNLRYVSPGSGQAQLGIAKKAS